MTKVDWAIKTVEDAIESMGADSAVNAEMLTALEHPAQKTVPHGFASVEAAEAAGGEWRPDCGLWIDAVRQADLVQDIECEFEDKYSRSALDEMDVDALSRELVALRALRPDSQAASHKAGNDERSLVVEEIIQLSSEIHSLIKHSRRQKSGAEDFFQAQACAGCSKLPAAGCQLKTCSRCQVVGYCTKECQVANWPAHKGLCKRQVEMTKKLESEGGDASAAAQKEVMVWFAQVPNVHTDCAALAWRLRAKQPVLVVEGGVNSRIAKITVLTRDLWTARGQAEIWMPRFASPTFDEERHYFCMISRGPARPELPVMTPRIQFPHSADRMDAFATAVEASKADQPSKLSSCRDEGALQTGLRQD